MNQLRKLVLIPFSYGRVNVDGSPCRSRTCRSGLEDPGPPWDGARSPKFIWRRVGDLNSQTLGAEGQSAFGAGAIPFRSTRLDGWIHPEFNRVLADAIRVCHAATPWTHEWLPPWGSNPDPLAYRASALPDWS